MKEILAYLTFNGNCKEAMTFYKDCFNAELNLMTFESAKMEIDTDYKDKILHAVLTKGNAKLMASDTMKGMKVENGSSVSLSLDCNSLDEIETLFNNLSDGGKITMPLQDTFWGARFGMLIDKFGMRWMLNFEKASQN